MIQQTRLSSECPEPEVLIGDELEALNEIYFDIGGEDDFEFHTGSMIRQIKTTPPVDYGDS